MRFQRVFERARTAARELNLIGEEKIDAVLRKVADAAIANTGIILAANRLDLDAMDPADPKFDRLLLTMERIEAIAADIRNVASLRSPVGESIETRTRPNSLTIEKVCVPLGVVGVIYEARPNVTFDVFAICLKSSNAAVLKGGSDASNSNAAIADIIREVLLNEGLNPDTLTLLPPEREATAELLAAEGYVDVIIPRGSSSLIKYVRNNSRIPVIETGAGICHTYFDASGDTDKGREIVLNAKTRRVSVCNALDTLVFHSARIGDLAAVCRPLAEKSVVIYADERAYAALEGDYPKELLEHAGPGHFGTEFLDYKMSVKIVDSIDEAVEHVMAHTSRHSEAIITEDREAAKLYGKLVDAACVYTNASTAFTDGAQFGLGAEIGISTQKLHARGPMSLAELTTYKYIITGNGQTRP